LPVPPEERRKAMRRTGLRRFWDNYNLSIVLAGLFLVSWVLQTWAGWVRFAANQQDHQQVAEVFGRSGYIFEWLSATMENWQSEFLQLLTFVVLTASLVHRGSHESKDSDDEMKAMIRRIEERLAKIE
jgi:hypothetical protein